MSSVADMNRRVADSLAHKGEEKGAPLTSDEIFGVLQSLDYSPLNIRQQIVEDRPANLSAMWYGFRTTRTSGWRL